MLNAKKLFLFDIDGVIRLGDKLIDGSIELYNYINSIGGKSIFITNNSTKGAKDYVDTFKKWGFNVDESNFLTALSVTSVYMQKHHKNDLIFVMGTNSLYIELKSKGLNVTNKVQENIKVVLVGYDTELTFNKVVDVCKILQTQKVKYYATNLDLKCPMPFGFVPDCGGIVEFIKIATNKSPQFLGKPEPEMVYQALALTNYNKSEALVVGDRLYTDIACGIKAGVDTCVVFSGEVTKKDLLTSSIKPTYQVKSVKELLKFIKK